MAILGSRIKLWIAVILLMLVAGFALYTWSTLTWSYSKGERAGWIQKFAQKGWMCKTWEGELVMVSMPGTLAEKFSFSVRDDSVAKRLNAAAGKRVVIIYEQHKGVPTACFGETEYFITDLRITE
jgi:hypothetical protein